MHRYSDAPITRGSAPPIILLTIERDGLQSDEVEELLSRFAKQMPEYYFMGVIGDRFSVEILNAEQADKVKRQFLKTAMDIIDR